MTTSVQTKKRLCATSLLVSLSEYGSEYSLDSYNGKKYNSFVYIEKGEVTFSSFATEIKAGPGDLIYIPSGLKYFSVWKGEPDIRFYNLHFLTDITDSPYWHALKIQKIGELQGEETGQAVREIYRLAAGDFADQMNAYAVFYALAAKAQPFMEYRNTNEMPKAMNNALEYIDLHLTTIESVSEIAAYCNISDSRLYHLFSEHMNTTPVTYINQLKIMKAAEMIQNTDLPLSEVAARFNYHSEYYFRKTFNSIIGMNPSKFRKRGSED